MPNKINLGGSVVKREAVAKADITPGELVENVGAPTAGGTVQSHSTANEAASPQFMTESSELDPSVGIGGTISAGDRGMVVEAAPGTRILAWCEKKAASGAGTITSGSLVSSNGDGSLQESTTEPVGRALETVKNDSSSAFKRIEIEVI